MEKPKSYEAKYGAITVLGKRPGCVLIVGVDDRNDIHLLDEFESDDCRKLAQKCFRFNTDFRGSLTVIEI